MRASSFAQWLMVAAMLGFGVGKLAGPWLEAQAPLAIFGSDSVLNTPSAIQSTANALKVIGK